MRGPPEPWHSGPVNDLDTLITEWLTLPDVAEHLDVEVSRVRRLIEEAGREPVERDTLYHRIERDGARWWPGTHIEVPALVGVVR